MKKEYVDVYIEWLKKDMKLIELQTENIRLCPQIRLEDEVDDIPKWTVEIIINGVRDTFACYGKLRYLFENAPSHLLKKEKEFVLFDGPNPVAKGKVLSDFFS